MTLLRQILHDLALVTLVVAGALGCAVLWKALGIESNVNAALATVNHGCAPGPCGTLAAFTKAVTKAGDATVTTQIQEQAIGKQVSATMTALQTIPAHVNGTMDSLTGTAQTASTSLKAITDGLTPVLSSTDATVKAAGAALDGLPPVEIAATQTAVRFNRFLDSPGMVSTEKNVEQTTAHVDAITGDAQKVADRYANPPKAKWYQKAWNVAKFGAETLYDFIR